MNLRPMPVDGAGGDRGELRVRARAREAMAAGAGAVVHGAREIGAAAMLDVAGGARHESAACAAAVLPVPRATCDACSQPIGRRRDRGSARSADRTPTVPPRGTRRSAIRSPRAPPTPRPGDATPRRPAANSDREHQRAARRRCRAPTTTAAAVRRHGGSRPRAPAFPMAARVASPRQKTSTGNDMDGHQREQQHARHDVKHDPLLQQPLQAVLHVELELLGDDRLQVRQADAVGIRQERRQPFERRDPSRELGAEAGEVAPTTASAARDRRGSRRRRTAASRRARRRRARRLPSAGGRQARGSARRSLRRAVRWRAPSARTSAGATPARPDAVAHSVNPISHQPIAPPGPRKPTWTSDEQAREHAAVEMKLQPLLRGAERPGHQPPPERIERVEHEDRGRRGAEDQAAAPTRPPRRRRAACARRQIASDAAAATAVPRNHAGRFGVSNDRSHQLGGVR